MAYANKTCYDCGIKSPANVMERVTEEYNSGRSDNSMTAGNLLFAPFSDTAAKKVKKNIVANNRRSYTRKRTVWKCRECSGHNDHYRKIVSKHIAKATKAVHKAQKGGLFSKPRVVSDECLAYLEELKDREGKTGTILSGELLAKIEASLGQRTLQVPEWIGLSVLFLMGSGILFGVVLNFTQGNLEFDKALIGVGAGVAFAGSALKEMFKPSNT
jgi:hypothetical protein